jgi:hypothetical protein
MSRKPEILCVGHDPMLNRTRRLILERCFAVKLAHSVPEALALVRTERFAIVLLCYTLTDAECGPVVDFVHGLGSRPKILALAEPRARRLPLGDEDEEFVSHGPAELLNKVVAMAGITSDDAAACAGDEATGESERELA